MTIRSDFAKYWVCITVGTFIGVVLGPFLFPSGLSDVHGMGLWGSVGLVGIALLFAILGYFAFTATKSITGPTSHST